MNQMKKIHAGSSEQFGTKYVVGDVIGCFIDIVDRNISKFFETASCKSCDVKILVFN